MGIYLIYNVVCINDHEKGKVLSFFCCDFLLTRSVVALNCRPLF